MKRLIVIGLLLCDTALAVDLTISGGLEQTPNSNYGNGAESLIRYEKLFGDFGLAVEGAYHGKTAHNSDSGTYGDVSGYSLLLEPIYHLPVSWRLKPYILGGLGWSWWHFDRSQDMIDRGIEVKLGNSLAYKVGVGADFPIGNSWFLDLEYFHFGSWVPKKSFYTSDGTFANVVSSDKNLGQETNCFMIGLKKRF